jgi:hypothetical protein
MASLYMDLSLIQAHSVPAKKVADGLSEFETYIRNNCEFIPNFGERYRQGETISTAFVQSTINQVVSRRFVKKQQVRWTLRGAHLLLQTRTKVFNNELEDVFRGWYRGSGHKPPDPDFLTHSVAWPPGDSMVCRRLLARLTRDPLRGSC